MAAFLGAPIPGDMLLRTSLAMLALVVTPGSAYPTLAALESAAPQVGSCDESTDAPPRSISRNAPYVPAVPSTDSSLDVATRDVPGGFAGMLHVDSGPRRILFLTNLGDAHRALEALQRVPGLGVPAEEHVVFRRARWTLAQLVGWYPYVVAHAGSPLRAASIDTPGNRIVIGVDDERRRREVIKRFETLNLPCQLVAVEVIGVVRSLFGPRSRLSLPPRP